MYGGALMLSALEIQTDDGKLHFVEKEASGSKKMLQYSKIISPRSVKDTSRLIPCIYICQEDTNMRRVSVRLFAGK